MNDNLSRAPEEQRNILQSLENSSEKLNWNTELQQEVAHNLQNNSDFITAVTKIINDFDLEFDNIEDMFEKNEDELLDQIDREEEQKLENFKENAGSKIKELEQQLQHAKNQNFPEQTIQELEKTILNRKKKYIKIVVGVGDKYEGSAEALEDEEGIETAIEMIPSMINSMTTRESLDYLKKVHASIDANWLQSDAVQRNYQLLSNTFNTYLSQKFATEMKSVWEEKRKVLSQEMLDFAKLITDRYNTIDSSLKDPKTAMNVLQNVILSKWWAIDQLIENWKIDFKDPFMDRKDYKNVVNDSFFTTPLPITQADGSKSNFQTVLWLDFVSDISEWTDYKDLSFEQKVKVWTLARFQEQMDWNWDEAKQLKEKISQQKTINKKIEENKTLFTNISSKYDIHFPEINTNDENSQWNNMEANWNNEENSIEKILSQLEEQKKSLDELDSDLSKNWLTEKNYEKLAEQNSKLKLFENQRDILANEIYHSIAWVFNNIILDTKSEILEETISNISSTSFWDMFDGKNEWEELGLSWIDAEIYHLYFDMGWIWSFNLSDETINNTIEAAKTGAIIVSTIVVAVVVTVASWWTAAPAVFATAPLLWWAVASTATWLALNSAINWQGYDSLWEFWKRAGTEFILNYGWMKIWAWLSKLWWTVLGRVLNNPAARQWMSQALTTSGVKLMSKEWLKVAAPYILKEAWVDAVDFSIWTYASYLNEKYVFWNDVNFSDMYSEWLKLMLLWKVGWYYINKKMAWISATKGWNQEIKIDDTTLSPQEYNILVKWWLLDAEWSLAIPEAKFKEAVIDLREKVSGGELEIRKNDSEIEWNTEIPSRNLEWETNLDFRNASAKDIAGLWNNDRLKAAEFYLEKELSQTQKDAIIKAHEVWSDRDWAWVYNYNQLEISEKARILKEAWFSKEERRVLLEKWISGRKRWGRSFRKDVKNRANEIWEKEKSLTEEIEFLNNSSNYEKLREIFPNKIIKLSDVIWTGKNAVILKNPSNEETVIKVDKPWKQGKTEIEMENQDLFYLWVEMLRELPRLEDKKTLLNSFNIVESNIINKEIWIFSMTRIKWHSLKTIAALEHNEKFINEKNIFPNGYEWLNDFEIMKTLKKNHLLIPAEWSKDHKRLMEKNKRYKRMYNSIMTETLVKQIKELDELLKENGLNHWDLHWWNIMKDEDGKYYIIDFWSSKIDKNNLEILQQEYSDEMKK